MSKVLLVDTNISSSPIYSYLLAAGHDVAVIGANPQDFLAKTAMEYIEADYSQPETLAAVLAQHAFDYIVPGCNDRSYLACAQLNQDRRFPGIDSLSSAETINNKQLFRSFAQTCGLPVPNVYEPEACPMDRPLIVKPVDAFSGRGVTILRQPSPDVLEQAKAFAKSMSRTETFLIEDFVDGQLFSHSCFLQGGHVLCEFIVEEHGTANPFVVDTSRVVHDFPPVLLKELRDCSERMAQQLNMVDGLIHTQFILHENKFWLIEVTRRCPGDLYSQLIELTTGVPYAELYARPFIDMPYPAVQVAAEPGWIMRHTMSQSKAGILGGIHFNCPVLLDRLYTLRTAGDEVPESPYGRIALLFIRASSSGELDELFALTLRRGLYSISN